MELEELLSEPVASAQKRRQSALTDILGEDIGPVVLFGAGLLGRQVLPFVKEVGLEPVAFIDNNPDLWGTLIDGVEVMAPAQLAQKYQSDLPSVIATIWSGRAPDRMRDRLGPLRDLGFKKIALFGHLAWRFPEVFLPHYSLDIPEKVLLQADNIRRAFNLISDEESRKLFVGHVRWRLMLDYDALPPASDLEIYFDPSFMSENKDEVLYDIGAFDGDTVIDFLNSGREFQEIHAFEPSPRNFSKLQQRVEEIVDKRVKKIYPHQLAVGDTEGTIQVENDAGPASRVGQGQETAAVSTLDHLVEKLTAPTFIKMDIEGFEPQCLEGGRRVITEYAPMLAVCVYHLQDHLWSLMLKISEWHKDYEFSFCPHLNDGWDLVLYAVPKHRLPIDRKA
ncbi:FkbM family methyltransferase [Castellaniella sp.]|uniref:FkbM family methyltransferase n=1 Tax=Castellaniella sp. TaxID=1955812 RepID=UPI002AFDF68C|nr:FkbM family methyltransferase [Castellaniella sp.]